jgi:serine phosphatase RsbU (regulator of sigma subunit)
MTRMGQDPADAAPGRAPGTGVAAHLGDIVLGLLPTAVIAFLFEQVSDFSRYRPASVLVLSVTALGLLRGRWATGSGAVAATVVVWWFLTPVERSFRFGDGSDALAIAVFVATMIGVWWLLARVDRARSLEAAAAGRAQVLLDLSGALAGCSHATDAARHVTAALEAALGARSLVVDLDGDDAVVVAARGYPDRATPVGTHLPLGGPGPLSEAVSRGSLAVTTVTPLGTGVAHGEDALHQAAGDVVAAWHPVTDAGGTTIGAIGVAWPYPRDLQPSAATLVQTVASIAGLALVRIAADEEAERDRFRSAMEAMIDQVVIGRSVRDGTGAIVDFEFTFANEAALRATGRTLDALVGRRACELYPNWREAGMFDRFRQVVETGVPLVAERLPFRDVATDGRQVEGFWNIQVVKLDDGYLSSSRDVTDVVEAERIAQEAREAAERERLAVELLQLAALPGALPSVPGLQLGAHYRPARDRQPVGGDWYDAFPLDDATVALVVADVAGHGQAAAGHMLQVRNIFRAMAIEHRDPTKVLTEVDRVLERVATESAPFVTCCYATLAPATGELRFALAGHPPPLVVGADGRPRFESIEPGPPLAALARTWPTEGRVRLDRGDCVVLYTDGLVERRGEHLDEGLERLRSVAVDLSRHDADAGAERLAASVDDPDDDIAILCAHLAG